MQTDTVTVNTLCEDLGLLRCRSFYLDARFVLAILAGIMVLSAGREFLFASAQKNTLSFLLIFNAIIWYPIMEEMLFRGIIQGQLTKVKWATRRVLYLSVANWITSLIFAMFHLLHHTPLWAALIFFPSLIFGYFRDYYQSIIPSLVLHSIYNLQFLFFISLVT